MTEHVCEWGLSYDYSTQNGLELYFFCKTDVNCRDRSFTADELAKFYTEYETLKAVVELLKGDDDGTEKCFGCGSMVEQVWHVSDELWSELSGYTQGDGILCSRCFDRKAKEQGIYLYWSCQPDIFPVCADTLEDTP